MSRRLSLTARVKNHSNTPSTGPSKATMSTSSKTTVQHFNDWPNAVGFDAAYEEREPIELEVKGHIPAYAAGTLFRTGLGQRDVKGNDGKLVFKTNHWFDAFSQVHRFQLHAPSSKSDKDGEDAAIERVTYNSRLTSDKLMERIQRTGKMQDYTFGATYDPCKSFFQKLQSVFERAPKPQPDEVINAVTISINYPGLSTSGSSHASPHDPSKNVTLCNKTDSSRLQFLDPVTLKPTGLTNQVNLHPKLKGQLSPAHPEIDPITGDLYSYNLELAGRFGVYRVFKTSASTGKTTILSTFEQPGAYLHSLFLTEHYVILAVWNSHFTMSGATILWNQNLLDAMYFNTSPAMWYVIDRRSPDTKGGKGIVAKFTSDPFFSFHSINAYEEPSSTLTGGIDVICDIVIYNDTSVMHTFYMDQLQSSNTAAHEQARKYRDGTYDNALARNRRYRLPNLRSSYDEVGDTTDRKSLDRPAQAIVEFTSPKTSCIELPTINPLYKCKPYRYFYGITAPNGNKSTFVDGLLKFDLQTQQTITWEKTGHTPGEAIFVPRPSNGGGELEEDDGVLLTVVLDGYTGKSYLLCLDARDLTEMGRVDVDGPIGFGFHGIHTSRL